MPIEVILKNEAGILQVHRKGIFEVYKPINGRMSWISRNDPQQAFWFAPKSNRWGIGYLDNIGKQSDCWGIAAVKKTGGKFPLDVLDHLWAYHNEKEG